MDYGFRFCTANLLGIIHFMQFRKLEWELSFGDSLFSQIIF